VAVTSAAPALTAAIGSPDCSATSLSPPHPISATRGGAGNRSGADSQLKARSRCAPPASSVRTSVAAVACRQGLGKVGGDRRPFGQDGPPVDVPGALQVGPTDAVHERRDERVMAGENLAEASDGVAGGDWATAVVALVTRVPGD
jgi:hypothetical protein